MNNEGNESVESGEIEDVLARDGCTSPSRLSIMELLEHFESGSCPSRFCKELARLFFEMFFEVWDADPEGTMDALTQEGLKADALRYIDRNVENVNNT